MVSNSYMHAHMHTYIHALLGGVDVGPCDVFIAQQRGAQLQSTAVGAGAS